MLTTHGVSYIHVHDTGLNSGKRVTSCGDIEQPVRVGANLVQKSRVDRASIAIIVWLPPTFQAFSNVSYSRDSGLGLGT